MISLLSGTVRSIATDRLVVEVGGFGVSSAFGFSSTFGFAAVFPICFYIKK